MVYSHCHGISGSNRLSSRGFFMGMQLGDGGSMEAQEYRGAEKRVFPRVFGHSVVQYTTLGGEQQHSDMSQLKNISAGGMLFVTGEDFASGQQLALRIRLPNAIEPVCAQGDVVCSEKVVTNLVYKTHVSFSHVNERDGRVLGEYIATALLKH